MDLRLQLGVWGFEGDLLPFAFCTDADRSVIPTDGGDNIEPLHSAVLRHGLPWIRPASVWQLDTPDGWEFRLNRVTKKVAVDWPAPHGAPLIYDVNFNPRGPWLQLARAHGVVLFFCGRQFNLAGVTDWREVLSDAAEDGALAGAAIRFREESVHPLGPRPQA